MPRKPGRRADNRVRVGPRVGMPFGGTVKEALVIEDRGDLGRGGEQMVRLSYVLEPDIERETDFPVSELLPPPDPAAQAARRTPRRAPRRPATA